MNVVDSSGWLEYFAGGSNASFFEPIITATDALVVPAICIHEVFKRLLSEFGEESALNAVGVMSLGNIADLTRAIAVDAAAISVEYQLAMADSIILATTRVHGATLWTQDKDFAGIPSVEYIQKR